MTSEAATADHDAQGSVIANKYRLDQLLGEGGMGSIWRAFNLQLELPVAVKLLRAGLERAELGERLRVEARAAAKLVHPNIVRVFDIGETEWGDPFIVMELLRGDSLAGLLERGPLDSAKALQLLLPIAEALVLAHSRGVVHRDLKPENIFLADDGSGVEPKLLDFGVAKIMSGRAIGARALTQAGTLVGSPDYMSPEQAQGRSDVDERTDVWSFCVVLYEALAGEGPFDGNSCTAVLRSVVLDEPTPLETFGIEPQLAALIARGLMKRREQRPRTILELGRALASWLIMRGVSQDVTGASLEAKWLGRAAMPSAHDVQPQPPSGSSFAERVTLRSVTDPRVHPSHEPIMLEARQHGRRRMLSTAVVATALAGSAAWASYHRSAVSSRAADAALPTAAARVEAVAAPQAQNALAPPPDILAVDDLPVVSEGQALTKPTNKTPSLKTPPTTFHVPMPAATAGAPPRPPASALPRALSTQNGRVDLMNPY